MAHNASLNDLNGLNALALLYAYTFASALLVLSQTTKTDNHNYTEASHSHPT